MLKEPSTLFLSQAEISNFRLAFGETWADAMARNSILNMQSASKLLGLDSDGLYRLWQAASSVVGLRRGLFCARVAVNQGQYYIINGFYGALRKSFLAPGGFCYCLQLEWDEQAAGNLSWADVLAEVVGHKDPSIASKRSIRGKIFTKWRRLGLEQEPDELNNCLHFSNSAFLGLIDRFVWSRKFSLEKDPLAIQLARQDVPLKNLQLWILNREPDGLKQASNSGKISGSVVDSTLLKGNKDTIYHIKAHFGNSS